MIEYTQDDLIGGLKDIGLKEGDVVLVSTELFRLGRLKNASSKDDYSKRILEAIFSVIKDSGTVVVNTYTTYVGRYGKVYNPAVSKPTTGGFSEYICFHPESIRSHHPINSVAAIGYRKKEICENVSLSNFGWDSPFDKLLKMNCQVLRLGIDYAHNVFLHVLEAQYGLPYVYNKILDSKVVVDGKECEKQFFASVRYLNIPLIYDNELLQYALNKNKCVYSARVGEGWIHRVDSNRYCQVLLSLVKENPYSLLKEPPRFIKGEIPWDGITAGRDNVPKTADYNL